MNTPDPNAGVPTEGPACPHCGGGPVVPILGTTTRVCRSCARVIGRQP